MIGSGQGALPADAQSNPPILLEPHVVDKSNFRQDQRTYAEASLRY